MNKKLIAVAVAGVVAAPAAYAADQPTLEERVAALETPPSLTMYGRIGNGIEFKENADGDNEQNMKSYSSRFGIKGNQDLGNGMSAFGHYEFSTTTDNDTGEGSGIGRRLGYVGLSGPFGSLSLGQQWSAYYSVSGNLSQNYQNGPAPMGPGRTGNTIQYSNSVGPISMKLDARADDAGDGGGNGFGLGLTLTPMDNAFVGVGFDSNDDSNEDHAVLAGGVTFGPVSLTLGLEQSEQGEDEETNNVIGANVSLNDNMSMLVSYSTGEDAMAMDNSKLTLGATYKFSGGFKVYGEYTDEEESGVDQPEVFLIAVQVDF